MGTGMYGNGKIVTCPHCGLRFREGQGDKYRTCLVCGYRWRSRGEGNPERCPSCRSSRWDTGEREAKCSQCGHEWIIRSEWDPRKCPRCQSVRWKERPENTGERTPVCERKEEGIREAMSMYSKGSSCLSAASATGVPLELLMREIRRNTESRDVTVVDAGRKKKRRA